MTHTPGPWRVEHLPSSIAPIHDDFRVVAEKGMPYIALMICCPELANARLIAAAPDLLEACQDALAKFTGDGWDGTLGHHPDNPIPAKLRTAIARATEADTP